jgi:hypothetical protein
MYDRCIGVSFLAPVRVAYRQERQRYVFPTIEDIMPKSRRSPERREYPKRDVNAGQRAVIAVQLRAKGLTYAEIYPQAGYTNGKQT